MQNVALSERENPSVPSLRSNDTPSHHTPLETADITLSLGIRSEQHPIDDTQGPRAAAQLPPGRSPGNNPQGNQGAMQYHGPRRIKTPLLDQFGDDITKRAQEGKVDPAIGRDKEIAQVVQTLLRRTKSNPVLIGEPGVGKSAVVEELARQIDVGLIPELGGKRIVSLSVGNLLAGTKLRGSLEEKIKGIIEEAKNSPDVILFIDEIHSVVASGGSGESGPNISNMLKPELARGQIRLIGATTIDEYRIIEQDPALERRFRPILVQEPGGADLFDILKEVKGLYENHHGVKITDEAVRAAATLTNRYIPDRYQPDKSLDAIDEACSAVKLWGFKDKANANKQLIVDEKDVASVISRATGIPVGSLKLNKKGSALELLDKMKERIIGQEGPIRALVQAEKREIAGVRDPKRPFVVFLVGPTGTGKTLTTQTFAELTARPLVRLDMSEFMENHTVSKLIGAPPGYVGFREPGQLTEAIRRSPNAVLLLDEIEKAHPDVFRMFLQVAEDGRLTDGTGREVDFKNVILVMTSNIGSAERPRQSFGFALPSANPSASAEPPQRSREELQEVLSRGGFLPEFINRIDTIAEFNGLKREGMIRIAKLELEKVEKAAAGIGTELEIDPAVTELVADACEKEFGNGRAARRVVQRLIEDPLAELILRAGKEATSRVRVGRAGSTITLNPAATSIDH